MRHELTLSGALEVLNANHCFESIQLKFCSAILFNEFVRVTIERIAEYTH